MLTTLQDCLEKIYIQDTCGVHNLHGLPGVFSGIASAIAAGVAEISAADGKVAYGPRLANVFVYMHACITSNLCSAVCT